MFRLHDARTGQTGPVQPARPGLLLVGLAAGSTDDPAGFAALRAGVVTDLVRRVADSHNLRVCVSQDAGGAAASALAEVLSLLNVHPLDTQPPGDQPDVLVSVGPVHRGEPGDVSPTALVAEGLDPLALRLALLESHYRQPLTLTRAGLAASEVMLRGWRQAAAEWARSPGSPMCAERVAGFLTAFDDDLDTPAALAVLRAVAEDQTFPPGAKFEMFAYFDRFLGLDLAREVGW